ncbi:MAG TPA: 2-hydroxyglutaryl-CoA dehydratase, partial [Deltaproteobacteria bacterium]|nr:2-hydroxyglutaryl-CoA dehydratase [Deltaproteobacteria bacterium]
MIVAGCDVGSLTSKAVVLNSSKILGQAIIKSGFKPEESAHEVMEKALGTAGLSMKDIGFCVGTGYGRDR